MKAATLHALLTARALFDEAIKLIEAGDRHLSSAGLVVLQDALEIVFLALLGEKGVDEQKALESKSFDELIGELKKIGLTVPKSGTLKALNKQRVITKHYGQLAEPLTVRVYAEAAETALAALLPAALGKSFRDIYLTELLDADSEASGFLTNAARLIVEENAISALIEIRKAIFVEIESEYSLKYWAKPGSSTRVSLALMMGYSKAPTYMQNEKWVAENVKSPTDYIQIDYERMRMDTLEWGVSTADLENIRRLTPAVFRPEKSAPWHVHVDFGFPENEGNLENAQYCLDRAISVLFRKQQHQRAKRWPRRNNSFNFPTIYLDAPVYAKASRDAEIVHRLQLDGRYDLKATVSGFDPGEKYYQITGQVSDPDSAFGLKWFSGYLLVQEEPGDPPEPA